MLNIKDYKGEKYAIKFTSDSEYDKLVPLLNTIFRGWRKGKNYYSEGKRYILLDHDVVSDKCSGYNILNAKDFLEDKPKRVVKSKDFKVGDIVVALPGRSRSDEGPKRGGSGYIEGQIYKIDHFSHSNEIFWEYSGSGIWNVAARKAKAEEIEAYHNGIRNISEIVKKKLTPKKETKSLVGRYLKALQDRAQCTNLKKGDYLLITSESSTDGQGSFKDSRWSFGIKDIKQNGGTYWELMPIGFNPEKKTPVKKVEKSTDFPKKWYLVGLTRGQYDQVRHYFKDIKKIFNTNREPKPGPVHTCDEKHAVDNHDFDWMNNLAVRCEETGKMKPMDEKK